MFKYVVHFNDKDQLVTPLNRRILHTVDSYYDSLSIMIGMFTGVFSSLFRKIKPATDLIYDVFSVPSQAWNKFLETKSIDSWNAKLAEAARKTSKK